jgi:hypothetical protein
VDIEHDYHKVVEKDHGRLEIRECWTLLSTTTRNAHRLASNRNLTLTPHCQQS